jgi:hypothetical protein
VVRHAKFTPHSRLIHASFDLVYFNAGLCAAMAATLGANVAISGFQALGDLGGDLQKKQIAIRSK